MNDNLKNTLENKGYANIGGFFSDEEVQKLRALCLSNTYKKTDSVIAGDIITHKDFRDIIFSEKLLELLKTVIGDDLYYVCDGTARGGDLPISRGARKFHSDSRADDFDFQNDYPIYRLGIYLQNSAEYSGGLKLRPKSHKKLCVDHGTLFNGCYRFLKYIQKYKKIPHIDISSGINIEAWPGDLLIWNMRLHHSGHAVRLKLFSRLSLHPLIENIIPKSWKRPVDGDRCVVFFAFGKKSEYLDNYFQYISDHPDNKMHWKVSNFAAPPVESQIQHLNIKLLSNHVNYITDTIRRNFLNKCSF